MNTRLMTVGEAADLLQDIHVELENGASLEGSLRYRAVKPGFVEVYCAYRTANDLGQGGMVLVEGRPIYVEGWTKAGNYVRIEGDPYGREREHARIFVDDRTYGFGDCQISRMRDGGSTRIRLPDGREIFKPATLGVKEPLFASLGSETLEPVEPVR